MATNFGCLYLHFGYDQTCIDSVRPFSSNGLSNDNGAAPNICLYDHDSFSTGGIILVF